MANLGAKALNWISAKFKEDASKMLIWTGVAGWTLSSVAQIGAVLFNSKISNEQKSFLIPQEFADAAVNIGSFFLVTQGAKKVVAKMFKTGKFAPKTVREYLNKNKDLYGEKVGKLDFNLDDVFAQKTGAPKEAYVACKNFGTTLATIGAGILSTNVITPIVRNEMAANMQKKYIDKTQNQDLRKPQVQSTTFKSGMRI